MNKKLCLTMVAVFFVTAPVLGAEDAGTKPVARFTCARLLALGDTGAAVNAGVYALGRNPAALSQNPAFGFTFTERALSAPSAHMLVAGTTIPLGAKTVLSFGLDDIWAGKIIGYNSSGNPTGEFSYHDLTFTGGFSGRFHKSIAVGGSFSYRRVGYRDNAYSSACADGGILFSPLPANYHLQKTYGVFSFGASVNDLTVKKAGYPSGDYGPTPGLTLGAAWAKEVFKRDGITITAEYSTAREEPYGLGFEYSLAYTAHLRTGHDGVGPTFGVGFSRNLFDFDYALVRNEAGYEHVATFSLYPGRDVRAQAEKRRKVEVLINEGRAYYEMGNYELAVRRFKDVLDWDPGNETASLYLVESKYESYLKEGRSFLEERNWERARRAFNAALNVMPVDSLAGRYLARTDELEKEEAGLAAVELKVSTVLTEVESSNRRGLYRRSITLLEEALAEIPAREELTAALALSRRLLAATEAAAVPVEVPPKEIPAAVRAQYERADALLAAGKINETISVLEPIVAEYPHYYEASSRLVESYMYRGLDLYSNGYLESALAYWRKVLALDPGNGKAKRYLDKVQAEIEVIRGEH